MTWFLLSWLAYALLSERRALTSRNIIAAVNAHRLLWMQRLVERDNRIADTALVGNLMRSVSFFASTTMLILGGLVAAIGSVDRSYTLVRDLPFTVGTTKEIYELKVLLLGAIFVMAFFKFTWALRQFNYMCIVIGGAPERECEAPVKAAFVAQAVRVNELAARSFNGGLQAYYFGLATLCWFVHPYAFAVATAAVIAVLYRRDFRSRTLKALRG